MHKIDWLFDTTWYHNMFKVLGFWILIKEHLGKTQASKARLVFYVGFSLNY